MVEEINYGIISRYGKRYFWLALYYCGYLVARYDLICIDLFFIN